MGVGLGGDMVKGGVVAFATLDTPDRAAAAAKTSHAHTAAYIYLSPNET
jgi:hypothetical protein